MLRSVSYNAQRLAHATRPPRRCMLPASAIQRLIPLCCVFIEAHPLLSHTAACVLRAVCAVVDPAIYNLHAPQITQQLLVSRSKIVRTTQDTCELL